MQEGLNFSVVLSGATFVSVLGLILKVFLSKQPQKIEQPIEVRKAAGSTDKEKCDERHLTLKEQIENIYTRLGIVETNQSAYKATQEAVKERLESMDNKLDKLIARKG
jgi:hypothetical protein